MAKLLQTSKLSGEQIKQLAKEQSTAEQIVELTKDELQAQFFLRAYSWQMWATTAQILYSSAFALWKIVESESKRVRAMGSEAIGHSFEIEHEFTARMLMGMSLEALLKGCIIAKSPSLVENNKLDKKIKTHKLAGLFRDVGIALSEPERNYCSTLTDFIEWQGRYPIPLEASKVSTVIYGLGNEWEAFTNLYDRVFYSVTDEEKNKAQRLYFSKEKEFYISVNKSHGID